MAQSTGDDAMTTLSRGVKDMIDREDQVAALKITTVAGGAAASALSLNDWVAILTILYLVFQIGLLLPKYVQIARDWLKNRSKA